MQTNFSFFLFEEDAAEGDDAAAPPDVPLPEDTEQVCFSSSSRVSNLLNDDSI